MSWSRWVSYCALSLALSACDRRPTTGVEVFGESTRLSDAAHRVASAVYDGRSVSLRGVRGETLGLTVRAAAGATVDLWMPAEGAVVEAFSVGSVSVSEPSTAMYGPSRGAGKYFDVLVPRSGPIQSDAPAYFDLVIRNDAKPGRHFGRLSVGRQVLPVVLDVGCGRIDLERDPLVWAFYLPAEIARAHGIADDDGAAELAVEGRYHQLFRAHGVFLAADLGPERFGARRQFVKNTRYWPVGIDTSSDASIERDVVRWLRLFDGTGVTPFAIPIDEPRTPERRMFARHVGEVIARAGGGRPRLLRGVTDRVRAEYGDSIDVYLSPVNLPVAASVLGPTGLRFWTYNGRPPQAGSMVIDAESGALRSWGWIAERYDVELWYAWEALYFTDRYNGGGVRSVSSNPLSFDERWRGGEDYGNGDGVLAYPGPLPSLRLKVLRRGLQDRLLLRQLTACGRADAARRIAERTVPRALGAGSGSSSWPANESEWERARHAVLDALEDCCHGGS